MEKKILYSTPHFDVIQSGAMYAIEPNRISVVVMPFERDDKGLPKTIGVLSEYNPIREGNYFITLVTGGTEEDDPDLLSTAMRELKEESGYDVSDPDRWCFLGFLTASKMVKQEHPCFAVDVTDLKIGERTTDGTAGERKSEFKMIGIKEALDADDMFIGALFVKIFKYIFNFEFVKQQEEDEKDPDKIRRRLDMKYLLLDGVKGSLVKTLEDGTQCIEYTVDQITDNIRESIPEEYNGIKITIKLLEQEHINQKEEDASL